MVNDLAYTKNNDAPKDLKKFYTEIELVQLMSNRIVTKKAAAKFTEILSTSPVFTEE